MKDPNELLTKYLHEGLSGPEMEELSGWIVSDLRNVNSFVLETFVNRRIRDVLCGDGDLPVDAEVEIGLLGEFATEKSGLEDMSSAGHFLRTKNFRYHSFLPKPMFLAMAALVLVAFATMLWPRDEELASLHSVVDARWAGDQTLAAGNQLAAGEYEILDGLVMLQYESGTEVIVEAPACFRLDTRSQLTLIQGRVVTTCPTEASHGFAVILPNAKVIDLGTEFGVRVDADGTSSTEVFDGVVEISPVLSDGESSIPGKSVSLAKGESGEIDQAGSVVTVVRNSKTNYVRRSDFEVKRRVSENSLATGWLVNYSKLQQDPDLLFWCDMHPEPKSTVLSNLANSNDSLPASVLKQRDWNFVAGRWAENLAVQVRQPSERLDIKVPGKFQNLTFAAWVKLFPENQKGSSNPRHRGLLLSNWEVPGHVHWQIKGDGFRVTAITESGGPKRDFVKYVASTPRLTSDEWHLLVSTIDTTDKQAVSHFLDGELIDRQKIKVKLPALSIGPCGIGGWSKSAVDDRNLNGSIDDIFIWSRSLSAREVKGLYQWGFQ